MDPILLIKCSVIIANKPQTKPTFDRVFKLFYFRLKFMLRLFVFFFAITFLHAAEVENFRWKDGVTYSDFLQANGLPRKPLLDDLDEDDSRLVEELRAGVHCHYLKDSNGTILQALIPLTDELQIHIYKFDDSYKFQTIPIIQDTRTEALTLKIRSNPSLDIRAETNSINLASIFRSAFGTSLDFTALRKDDNLVMIYDQKYRLGKPFSMPTLKAAMIELNKKPRYIYLNDDGRYYDEKGSQVESFLLARPVNGGRISSHFSKRRFHPVLKKWKAHLGMDYAARSGTPVVAAGNGTIIFASRLGSYGNLIKLRHKDGFETRYAHLKGFRKGIRSGKSVKKNQIIGYVGTTGRSTGPHLHFELRKNGVAINPAKQVQLTTNKLTGKEKKAFDLLANNYNESIALHLKNQTKFIKEQKITNRCYFNNQTQGRECVTTN